MTSASTDRATSRGPLLFCFATSRPFGEAVAQRLGCALGALEERIFEGGEHKTRPLVEVGDRDVFVVQSLDGEPGQSCNDKLVRLLFLIGALKDAGAGRVTAVTPYLAYARKDRRTKPRDPINSRYVAALFEAVGTDRLLALEVHNVAAFENAFRHCRAEHLPVAGLLADYIASILPNDPIAVVSPDAGGMKRAELFRSELEKRLGRPVGKALMDKHRSAGVVSGVLFAGDVKGCVAVIIDDLISTGTTIVRAATTCRAAGATRVIAAAAHGLFTDGAPALFGPDGPEQVIVTDSVPVRTVSDTSRIHILSAAGFVADAISRLHRGEPFYELLPYD